MSFRRVAGWAGIAAVVAFVAGSFMVPQPPAIGDAATTAAKISDFYVDHHAGLWTASLILGAGFVLILVWGAGMWASVGRSEQASGEAWSVAALLGLAGVVILSILSTAINDALALLDGLPGDPGTLLAVYGVGYSLAALTGLLAVPVLVGFSLAGARAGLVPAWLSGLGLVGAALGALGTPAAFVTSTTIWSLIGLAGFLVAMVWILVTSILMVRPTPTASTDSKATA